MNVLSIAGIGAAALIIYNLINKGNTAQNLTFKISDIDLGTGLKLQITVTNPSATAIGVNSINGSIEKNGKQIATFSKLEPITLPATSETRINIPISLDIIGAGMSVLDLLRNPQALKGPVNIITSVFTPIGKFTLSQSIEAKASGNAAGNTITPPGNNARG